MSNYDRKPECQHCSHYDELKVQNHGLTLMVVKAEKIQADLDMAVEALTQANELMEKLINGDKFHQEYLLKTQAMADKALEKLK